MRDEINEEDAARDRPRSRKPAAGIRIKFHSKRAALLQLTKTWSSPFRYDDKRDYSQLTDGQLDTPTN